MFFTVQIYDMKQGTKTVPDQIAIYKKFAEVLVQIKHISFDKI